MSEASGNSLASLPLGKNLSAGTIHSPQCHMQQMGANSFLSSYP